MNETEAYILHQLRLLYELAERHQGKVARGYYAMACRLVENQPQGRLASEERALAYRRLGDACLACGDIVQAEASYEQCVSTRLPRCKEPLLAAEQTGRRAEALDRLAEVYDARGKATVATLTRQRAAKLRAQLASISTVTSTDAAPSSARQVDANASNNSNSNSNNSNSSSNSSDATADQCDASC
ncbi:hypothetical protein THASP1DRAFT_30955 [Thamnocephalis sphaerospora]|uniref:Uncharacterized protein n=1 Tax=Thamnocephalis sphaerospora TaxID=78915 RepID=A0A4P9XMV7_9FUNG|nr:hypothetical protein THASP1DRAFT_30955 [Thamnocephalis sphaerospora]|eukprot:RKP07235.1 hypothetical protein THASP1DRAFT_30955 [Thamnocephalis sphaerospora]